MGAAACANIKIQTGVFRHGFLFPVAATGAGYGGAKYYLRFHLQIVFQNRPHILRHDLCALGG